MRSSLITAVLLLIELSGPGARADAAGEIDHLLEFIGSSECTFIRNGEPHDAADARAHIERKYDYGKRWLETAEQFIEHAATRSSVSGVLYRVNCDGRVELSSEWLMGELTRYRATATVNRQAPRGK